MLTDLIHHVDEQSRVVNAVREHQESVPQIASSIVTPSIQAVNPSKKSKPPNLPIFSGDVPTPRSEVEYTQWIFQLKLLGQYLKSATFTAKTKFSKSSQDPRNQSQGPGPLAAGPFRNSPPVQCYKCNCWGHYQRQCPNREKVTVANDRENSQGEDTREGGSTP